MKRAISTLLLSLLLGLPAEARLVMKDVDYSHEGKPMQGYLVYEDALVKPGQAPGILVFHAWMGIGKHEHEWADQLAAMGYVVFAPDIYGKGIRPGTPEAAGKQATIYRSDRKLMRSRAQAGLNVLLAEPGVDKHKVAAIGFCFGGGVALELARSGAPLAGVVSLHGNLDTPNPADARQIKGQVLVLHGADDPHVKPEQVAGFAKEMHDAGVKWQLNAYGGAVHAFSDPNAGNDVKSGAAYNAEAAKRSWQDMTRFFANLFS
ncbi:MAG: dienelactone hydrolase family protein [Candidatus Sericytochromatia bacterium]